MLESQPDLRALVAEAMEEYFRTADMDKIRKSPAGAIIRLEEKIDRIEEEAQRIERTMATKEELKALHGRFNLLLSIQLATFGMIGAILVKVFFR